MKKLIFGLLTLITGNLYADSVTSGSVGLLKISTGVVGTRNWGDKYNENFQIIANTMSAIITGAIGIPGTTPVYPTLQSPTTGVYNLRSDQGTRYSIANSTGIEVGQGLQLTTYFSTATSDFDSIRSSMATLSVSTSSISLFLSTNTLVGYNNGVPLTGGNITAINAAGGASQVGSTLTLTAAAASGGGSGSLSYRLIVGTDGATNVDMFVSSISNWNIMLSSIGTLGLTSSATGYGQIFFRDGVYKISNATVPAGVTIVCGSSVTFVSELPSVTQFTVYGKMQNCNFDISGIKSARTIRMKSGSQNTNFKIYNFPSGQGSAAGGSFGYCTLCVDGSSNVKVQGEFSNFITNNAGQYYGDEATFMVVDSSNVDIQVSPNFATTIGASSSFVFFGRSKNVNYHDSTFLNSGGDAIVVGPGNQDIFFERNKIQINQTAGDQGYVMFAGDSGPGFGLVSTGTVSFSYNDWNISTSDSGNIFSFFTGGNGRIDGVRIKGNAVHRTLGTAASYTFANIASTIADGTVLQGNNMAGITTFIIDGGNKTIYAGQGNTLYDVEQ